jgi:hypothetical protein
VTARWNALTFLLTAAVVAAVAVFVTGPRAPRSTIPAGTSGDARTIRGAFHIHTTRSDGALDRSAVAAAAARAGLRFAVFTDHGNGLRPPEAPAYHQGVLCLDGVEISTNHGHYIAVGIPAAPYPLGGDADAVAEDVTRLGGFGVAAHPVSARAELAWSDWSVPIDGLEWLNADSEWRDEGRLRLARGLLDYAWRPAGALAELLDRPVEALRRWDQLTATRRVVALAGHDAHGGLGAETGGGRGRRLHVPSYEASFRTFSVYATLEQPPSGNPATDAAALIEALREGAVFSAVDAIANPATLEFRATLGNANVTTGGRLPEASGTARFSVRASVPPGAITSIKRNGRTVAEKSGGVLDHETPLTGAYRVEIDVPGAPGTPPVPWLASNPIYRFESAVPVGPPARPVAVLPLANAAWRVEADPGSSGAIAANAETVALTYRLKDEERASQFVALVVDLQSVPADANAITLRGRADRPMRVSAQLRFGGDRDERWGRSFYLDPSPRDTRIPLDTLRRMGGANALDGRGAGQSQPLPVARATSLLFVIDLTNANPGDTGTLTVADVALGRQ